MSNLIENLLKIGQVTLTDVLLVLMIIWCLLVNAKNSITVNRIITIGRLVAANQ